MTQTISRDRVLRSERGFETRPYKYKHLLLDTPMTMVGQQARVSRGANLRRVWVEVVMVVVWGRSHGVPEIVTEGARGFAHVRRAPDCDRKLCDAEIGGQCQYRL
jgi:hypothetical protein